ncbi:Purine nucleoside phosphoramidase [Actinomadura sp. RB68]|uniref:Purine nucleoside phosphoramidase n=2 Tax=Actinomadura macrotermitis TaxID=2585200 RepID=A0A7K0BNH8_9ACTN|nr:Purine nucleoside phosphoramidase [Actinomadura macrotermitis]
MSGPDSVRAMTDCLFCKIVSGDVPAEIVRESDRALAFRDINPQAPTHVLVIPREHHPNVGELAAADPGLLAEVLREANQVAVDEGVAGEGFRVVFNTGPRAGQTVFHVHAHVIGGRDLNWPPG